MAFQKAKSEEKTKASVSPETAPEAPQLQHSGGAPAGIPLFLARAMSAPSAPGQSEFTIVPVDDGLEHEAERVANQIPSSQIPSVSAPGALQAGAPPQISRKSAAEGSPTPAASAVPGIVHESLRSPGHPLAAPARAYFEPRFGRDFSEVRAHTDEQAAQSSEAIQARAYTAGNDIVFGRGQFSTSTSEGRKLLAHELTHVVQQSGPDTTPRRISRAPLEDRPADTWDLDIYPAELHFEPTRIGEATSHKISISSRNPAGRLFGGFFGGSAHAMAPTSVRGAPKAPSAHYVFDGPFRIVDDPEQRFIPAGRSIEVWVDFVPPKTGTYKGMFWLLSEDGDDAGLFTVAGEDLEESQASSANSPAARTPTETKDPAVHLEREKALPAVAAWQAAEDRAISTFKSKMLDEWGDYFSRTSSNPYLLTASPQFLSSLSGQTILRGVSSTTREQFAGLVAGHLADSGAESSSAPILPSVQPPGFNQLFVEHGIASPVGEAIGEKAGEYVAHHFSEQAVGLGLALAAGEVGSVAGPMGAAVAFVVTLFVEAIIGMFLHWISGEDEEVKKAIREAFDLGVTEGSAMTGMLIKAKARELDAVEAGTRAIQNQRRIEYETLVNQSTDVRRIRQLKAEIEARTDLANVTPGEGFGEGLLALWVREHAATADESSGVIEEQWNRARVKVQLDRALKGQDTLWPIHGLEQPDLFVTQCLYEWARRGLSPSPELQANLYGELAHIGIQPSETVRPEEPESVATLAHEAQRRFNRREFVWDNVFDLQGKDDNIAEFAATELQGNRLWRIFEQEGEPVSIVDEVLCYPVLKTDGEGACYVDHFDYRIDAYGQRIYATSDPGGELSTVKRRIPKSGETQQDVNDELYTLIELLADYGLDVSPQSGAGRKTWLQKIYGSEEIAPRIQHGDGGPEKMPVFTVSPSSLQEALTSRAAATENDSLDSAKFGTVLDVLDFQPAGVSLRNPGYLQQTWQPPFLVVRGGDTVLIIQTAPTVEEAPTPSPSPEVSPEPTELDQLIALLGSYGLTVSLEQDAGPPSWLQATFGDDAQARILAPRRAYTGPGAVQVYKIREIVDFPLLHSSEGQWGLREVRSLPDDVLVQALGLEHKWRPTFLLIREENTFLVIELPADAQSHEDR